MPRQPWFNFPVVTSIVIHAAVRNSRQEFSFFGTLIRRRSSSEFEKTDIFGTFNPWSVRVSDGVLSGLTVVDGLDEFSVRYYDVFLDIATGHGCIFFDPNI